MGQSRRTALAAIGMALAGSLALLGCEGAGGGAQRGKFENATDMAIGDPNAPLTVVEYASVTCGVCKFFHDNVYPTLKTDYIDTGKVRFVFRELPTPPAEIASAGFQVARCGQASPETYFSRLDVLFDQQQALIQAAQAGQAGQYLQQIAQAAGLTPQQYETCVRDEAGYARIKASVEEAEQKYEVTGTPTLIVNGDKLANSDTVSIENLRRVLDEKLSGA